MHFELKNMFINKYAFKHKKTFLKIKNSRKKYIKNIIYNIFYIIL